MSAATTTPAPDLATLKADWPLFNSVTGVERIGTGHCFNSQAHKHGDKSASLSVSQVDGGAILFHCKGCGIKGSVIDAYMLLNSVTQDQAIEALKRMSGAPQSGPRPASPPPSAPPPKQHQRFKDLETQQESYRRQGFTVAAVFPYPDATGQYVFSTIRLERGGDKQFRPSRPLPSGQVEESLPDGPRPLYGLTDLLARPGEQVLVVEGEGKVDQARRFGFLAVSSCGGAQSPERTDWTPLKNRDALITPDNDKAGQEYAQKVRELVLKSGARSARITPPLSSQPKGDIKNRIHELEQEGKDEKAITTGLKAELRWDVPAPDMRTGPRTLREWLESPDLRRRTPRLSTGYPELDKALDGGLVYGSLYTVTGRTGEGKSTLSQNIARRISLNGVKTLLISLEDRPLQVVRKFLAASSHVPLRRIEELRFEQSQREPLNSAKNLLASLPLTIDGDTSSLDALALLISANAAQDTKLVIADQVSWIVTPGESAYERITAITRRLKMVARDTGIVLLLVVQVNRTGSKKDEGPDLHDLRDSGTIEQDSDGVIIIKKSDIFFDGRPAIMHTVLEKHRHGPQKVPVTFTWFQPEQRIESYTPADVTGYTGSGVIR